MKKIKSISKEMRFIPDDEQPESYCTSDKLHDQGICVCDNCGKLCSIDYRWCSACERPVVIIRNSNSNNYKTKNNGKEKEE